MDEATERDRELAVEAADAIRADLEDRSGLLDGVDDAIREEMRDEHVEIILPSIAQARAEGFAAGRILRLPEPIAVWLREYAARIGAPVPPEELNGDMLEREIAAFEAAVRAEGYAAGVEAAARVCDGAAKLHGGPARDDAGLVRLRCGETLAVAAGRIRALVPAPPEAPTPAPVERDADVCPSEKRCLNLPCAQPCSRPCRRCAAMIAAKSAPAPVEQPCPRCGGSQRVRCRYDTGTTCVGVMRCADPSTAFDTAANACMVPCPDCGTGETSGAGTDQGKA